MIDANHLCPSCMKTLGKGTETNSPCPYCGFVPGTKRGGSRALEPFTILAGRYLLGNAIGAGGFGIIYIALDLVKEERAAVKEFFPPSLAKRDGEQVEALPGEEGRYFREALRSFRREAALLSRFSHVPGIVGYRDLVEENGTAYLVMDYAEGTNLRLQMRRMGGTFSQDEALELMRPILLAVGQLHSCHVIHRDVSPENLILGPEGKLTLIDFGAAREFSGEDENLTVILKRGYAPEEQYRSGSRQGPWTDIYACCAVLYQMVSGILPQEADRRKAKDQVMPLDEIPGIKVTERFARAIEKGMTINAAERFPSVESFMRELDLQAGPEKQSQSQRESREDELRVERKGGKDKSRDCRKDREAYTQSQSGGPESQEAGGRAHAAKVYTLAAVIILTLAAVIWVCGRVRQNVREESMAQARQEEREEQAEEFLWQAEEALLNQEYEEALADFEEAADRDPFCQEAYQGQAAVYLHVGDRAAARFALSQGMEWLIEEENFTREWLDSMDAYKQLEFSEGSDGMIQLVGRIQKQSVDWDEIREIYPDIGYISSGASLGLDLREMGGAEVVDELGQTVVISETNLWTGIALERINSMNEEALEEGILYRIDGFWMKPEEYFGRGKWMDERLFGPTYVFSSPENGGWYSVYPYGHYVFFPAVIERLEP